jgi:rubrerythrin
MANFICEFEGVRGRNLKLYDTKIIITTKKTVGSLITGNFTDGEKTIYLRDVVGVQFKKSGGLIGYLQFETPSMQMNNKSDNMFSENTFTYENGKNGITNELMIALYEFVTDRIEELKYTTSIINETPDFEAMKECEQNPQQGQKQYQNEQNFSEQQPQSFVCPKCGMPICHGDSPCKNCGQEINWNIPTTSNHLSKSPSNPQSFVCPKCGTPINYGDSPCKNCGQEIAWSNV